MSDNKSKKMPGILARLRMVVGLNIGTIMFGILFIYMAFSAILYFTTSHIESYQVTSGPLSRNETYTGLASRIFHTLFVAIFLAAGAGENCREKECGGNPASI